MCDANAKRLSLRLCMPFLLPRHPNSACIGASVQHSHGRAPTLAITQNSQEFTPTHWHSQCDYAAHWLAPSGSPAAGRDAIVHASPTNRAHVPANPAPHSSDSVWWISPMPKTPWRLAQVIVCFLKDAARSRLPARLGGQACLPVCWARPWDPRPAAAAAAR